MVRKWRLRSTSRLRSQGLEAMIRAIRAKAATLSCQTVLVTAFYLMCQILCRICYVLSTEWIERIFCCSDKRSAISRRRGHHQNVVRFGMKRVFHLVIIGAYSALVGMYARG